MLSTKWLVGLVALPDSEPWGDREAVNLYPNS